jgi:DNA polymerase-3 subunit delta
LDGRKKLAQEIAKHGVIFESKKLYDNQVVPFIVSYLRKQNVKIEPKAAQLAFDSIGATITRFIKELEKIIATLPENNRTITTKQIEQNIGISRNFNNFELIKAIAKRDPAKAYQIAKYFSENPKNNTLVLTLSVLFSYFANLMICHYEKDKSRNAIKQALGLRSDIQIDDYSDGLENYTATKTMNIISLIRSTDAQSKGVGNPSLQNATLLKELLYKIMH